MDLARHGSLKENLFLLSYIFRAFTGFCSVINNLLSGLFETAAGQLNVSCKLIVTLPWI